MSTSSKVCWKGIFVSEIWNVFAYSARTTGLMDKQRPEPDSVYSKSVKITFQDILTVGVDSI